MPVAGSYSSHCQYQRVKHRKDHPDPHVPLQEMPIGFQPDSFGCTSQARRIDSLDLLAIWRTFPSLMSDSGRSRGDTEKSYNFLPPPRDYVSVSATLLSVFRCFNIVQALLYPASLWVIPSSLTTMILSPGTSTPTSRLWVGTRLSGEMTRLPWTRLR